MAATASTVSQSVAIL